MVLVSEEAQQGPLQNPKGMSIMNAATTIRRTNGSSARPTDGRKTQEITLEAPEPLTITVGARRKSPDLTLEEARHITDQIRSTSLRLWLLVVEAHDRKAHIAMGYDTWADYVVAELKMSESRSYQLIDTGHVMRELAASGVDVEHTDPPPARVIARIKDRLPDVRKVAREAVKKDEPLDVALRSLAREPKEPHEAPAARGAPAAADTGTATVTPEGEAAKVETVKCPACRGTGQVEKGLAGLIRDLMRSAKK